MAQPTRRCEFEPSFKGRKKRPAPCNPPSSGGRTLLRLDNVLVCLHESIPKLSHSALHRCLVRRGLPLLPKDEENTSKRLRFAGTKIGSVHIDLCELRSAEGKVFLSPFHRSGLAVR